jgi:Alw26I/Eco31I/Esp3I family type II restriction m6 adenine DNA methyltransferase
VFDANRRERDVFPLPSATALKATGYTIPVSFGAGSAKIFDQLAALPELASFEDPGPGGLLLGRELDETRIHEKIGPGRKYPFIKGRMLKRHAITEQPSMSVHQDLASRIKSARFPRAVWRDVSRSSQKRRMIGAVIPPGWIAGNSLHVAHFRDGDLRRTLALHAILSSFVLEFQVRSRLATGHMSLGVVRKARVPELDGCAVELLADTVRELDPTEPCSAARLEVAVAKAYGLDRISFEAIVNCFEKVDDVERCELLSSRHWG